MPDLGIGEALAAFGGSDLLAGLFGGGEAAAAGATAEAGTDLAGIVGSGEGLFGGATGLEGTLLSAGVPGADIASGAALSTAGLGSLGTAADFLAAPGASGFDAAALTPGFGDPGGGPGVLNPSPAASPVGGPGTSIFDTGGQAGTGANFVSPTGQPSPNIAPAGTSASSIAPPSGVSSPVDATSAALNPAPGAAGPPASAGTPASSIDQLLNKLSPSNLASGAVDSITKNPLGIALGVGGLGYNIFEGQKNTANQKALTADANTATANSNQMVSSGEALQQYLTNGTLPPAYQQQVDQAIQDAKTAAISNAAAQGQSTDPTQNTSLQQTLAKIDASRPAMQTQVASQLFSSGSSLVSSGQNAAGLSGQLFQALVSNDTTQAANTGKAIASLAAALNGKSQASGGGTTITVG